MFRFAPRHLLIPIAYLVILRVLFLPFFVSMGLKGAFSLLWPTMLISPLLLAFLVVLIERNGPIRNWAVSLLLFLFYPALALYLDVSALLQYHERGVLPNVWVILGANAFVGINLFAQSGRLVPRACPSCRKKSLIRLIRLFREEKRSSNTWWCALCGGMYWKDHEGAWQVERRKTWWGNPTKSREAANGGPVRSDSPQDASPPPHQDAESNPTASIAPEASSRHGA